MHLLQFDTQALFEFVFSEEKKYKKPEIAMAYRREATYLVREHTKDKALVHKLSARSLVFYLIYLYIFLLYNNSQMYH